MGQFSKAGNPQGYAYKTGDTITNGQLAVWDPTVTGSQASGAYGAARPLPSGIGSSGAWFLGVFQDTQPISSNLDNNNPLSPQPKVLVQREGIFPFKTTNSETYVHGTAVYATAGGDGLTITTVSGGNTLVGFANLPDGSQVTGAAGVLLQVELTGNITLGSNAILSA